MQLYLIVNSPNHPAQDENTNSLLIRLNEAEATLKAIRTGQVDAVIGENQLDPQVFTLGNTGDCYRTLIESMNEGALMVTRDMMVLYSNACFARMVNRPLEQVIGASFRDFIAPEDNVPFLTFLSEADQGGSKVNMSLRTNNHSATPILVSICPLVNGGNHGETFGMLITDMTESRRNEELLRGFSQRLVQRQEAERERVASELHGRITQLLCAVLAHSEVITDKISRDNLSARAELKNLREMVGEAATAVERISRHLRPSVLDHLGLSAMLHNDTVEFTKRTGVPLELNCGQFSARLPPAAELALYRILQEALKNVEIHAQAKQATVHLTQLGAFVELSVQDDGIGFDPACPIPNAGFGLHSMRERAIALSGSIQVKSASGHGTTIHAQIPIAEHKIPNI